MFTNSNVKYFNIEDKETCVPTSLTRSRQIDFRAFMARQSLFQSQSQW